MRRALVAGLLAVVVIGVVAARADTTSATPPPPSPGCAAGAEYLAGYVRSNIYTELYVDVEYNSGTVYGDGHIAGWVGVDDGGGIHGYWIQAGVRNFGSGPELYIEYDTPSTGQKVISEGAASAGVHYSAFVEKISYGVWTASIGGHSLGYNVSLSGMSETQYMGESVNGSSTNTCNAMNFYFSAASPWVTSLMNQVALPPYQVHNDPTSANAWTSSGS